MISTMPRSPGSKPAIDPKPTRNLWVQTVQTSKAFMPCFAQCPVGGQQLPTALLSQLPSGKMYANLQLVGVSLVLLDCHKTKWVREQKYLPNCESEPIHHKLVTSPYRNAIVGEGGGWRVPHGSKKLITESQRFSNCIQLHTIQASSLYSFPITCSF